MAFILIHQTPSYDCIVNTDNITVIKALTDKENNATAIQIYFVGEKEAMTYKDKDANFAYQALKRFSNTL